MMNIDELFDVLPISHYHSLELHFATQYVGEEVLVYVSWDSINLSRVHHQRVSAGFDRCPEGRQIVLAKSNLRNESWRAVASSYWSAVSHIVFQASGDAVLVGNIGAFVSANYGYTHGSGEIWILSVRFINAGPKRLPPNVEYRREIPWN